MIYDDVSLCLHDARYAIIGRQSQAETSDNRDCASFYPGGKRGVTETKTTQPEAIEIFGRLDALGLTQRELAGALRLAENKISKVRAGGRRLTAGEFRTASDWLDGVEARGGYVPASDMPDVDHTQDYLPVEVLPSYAGMGGGGSGEGDVATALIPRTLVEDELRAKPADLLLIEARGESMQPDFLHGDQILIDRRDTNPVQPGTFALWDGDGYVVKLVERIPRQLGRYRIFSANDRFSAYEVDAGEVVIMGRPVWFGRRL